MKNLQLSLKSKWFEMTKAGIKKEDYRELNIYWFKRLVYNHKDVLLYNGFRLGFHSDSDVLKFVTSQRTRDRFGFDPFLVNIMTKGYPKSTDTDRILKLEHKGIEVRTGNPEWGAVPGKLYFVIKHGRIL